jgi:hypothetical protein
MTMLKVKERDIQAGEREVIKASEEVQVRNLIAFSEVLKNMRGAIVEIGQRVDHLQNRMMTYDKLFEQQRQQIAYLQQQIYQKGSLNE